MSHKLVYNDSTHAYTLNGRRTKSVTAVAKIAPDSWALEQWRKRQVAIGLMLEPRLAERVAVDPDNREAVDQVCEEAMQIAGAHHAANRGAQRHRASELADLDKALLTQQQRDDAQAWRRTIEHHGIEILPQFVEGFAIWPNHGVTGRFDRFARYQGRTVVVDLKSGENSVKYPQGTAVQLALYARAPLVSAEIAVAGDRSTVTRWTPPPADLDLEVGYVVLLGDDMEIGELWEIDITHGWVGAQHALSIVDWRKAHSYGADLARPVKPVTEAAAVALLERELGAVRLEDPRPTGMERHSDLSELEADRKWSQGHKQALMDRVRAADSNAELEALWSQHRAEWTDELTVLAKARKVALHQQPLRDVAATAARK